MATVPQARATSSRGSLSAEEREVVAVYNDADRCWHIYRDSLSLRGAMRRLAQRVGAEIRAVGTHGFEFDVPGILAKLARRRGGGRPGENCTHFAGPRRSSLQTGGSGPQKTSWRCPWTGRRAAPVTLFLSLSKISE